MSGTGSAAAQRLRGLNARAQLGVIIQVGPACRAVHALRVRVSGGLVVSGGSGAE